jgi:predicted TIM-barrel fold metal-dependent hydrolase
MRTNIDAFLALPLLEETKRKILSTNAAGLWP